MSVDKSDILESAEGGDETESTTGDFDAMLSSELRSSQEDEGAEKRQEQGISQDLVVMKQIEGMRLTSSRRRRRKRGRLKIEGKQ